MKIVHVTEAWNGGIATYVNTLLRRQAESEAIDSITLVYSENQTEHDFDKALYERHGIKLISYESSRNPFKVFGVARRINNIIKNESPDLVHLHSTFPGVYGRLFAQRCKIVYCPHGWSFVQEEGRVKKRLYAAIERVLARRTDAIIHISRHERKEAEKAGIKAAQDKVVYNGVPNVCYVERPSIGMDPSCINIGFIGRMDYKKGFDILAEIFSREGHNPRCRLYVLGEPCRDEPVAFKSDYIHTLGWVNHERIDDYIRRFDAVIMPSRQEGFGLAAIEAMRNAKPVICSRSGGLPEIVQDGHSGYLFDIESCETELRSILSALSKVELDRLGKNGRAVYEEKFTDVRMADEVLSCYKDVLAN